MSLGCAGCGECCNPIKLSRPTYQKLMTENTEDGMFAREHWGTVLATDEQILLECDRFDDETLQCTAHGDRPPICSGYPFYGRQPNPADLGSGRILDRVRGDPHLGCSYLLDIPAAWRPPGVRPLIPLEVL